MEVKQWKRKLGREKEKTKKNLDKALDRVEILDDADCSCCQNKT